jgi:hypothetical protein
VLPTLGSGFDPCTKSVNFVITKCVCVCVCVCEGVSVSEPAELSETSPFVASSQMTGWCLKLSHYCTFPFAFQLIVY